VGDLGSRDGCTKSLKGQKPKLVNLKEIPKGQ